MSSRLLPLAAVMAGLAGSFYALPAPPAVERLALDEQLRGPTMAKDRPAAPTAKPARGGIDCTTGVSCPMIWAPKK